MKYIHPPLGYKFNDNKGVLSSNTEDVMDIILGLSNLNKDGTLYIEAIKHTHKERLQMLKDLGFRFLDHETD